MTSPIETQYRENMNALASGISSILGPGVGFALLVFPLGSAPDGRVNYISNAQRKDMLVAMKEFIARAEGQADVKGTA